MRNLTLIVLFIALAVPASAKRSGFHLGITTGINSALINENIYVRQSGPIMGGQVNIKALRNWRKWQLGGGVEIGGMAGWYDRASIAQYNTGVYTSYSNDDFDRITAPYIAPHLIFNHKIKFPRRVYLYIGGIGGAMIATNTMGGQNTSYGWLAGANFGAVIKLNKLISLDISEGFRAVGLRDVEGDYPNVYTSPSVVSSSVLTHTVPYNLNMYYFSFNVGLRFKL